MVGTNANIIDNGAYSIKIGKSIHREPKYAFIYFQIQ